MGESFVIILRPAPAYGNEDTDSIIRSHFNYLKKMHTEGIVKAAGRFSEVLVGLVMIETDTIQEAQDLMNNDPAVKAGVFHAELYPWSVAVGAFIDG